MATRTQKIRLGIFLLGAATLLVVAIALFGGSTWWADREHYRILVGGSVSGLNEGAEVKVQGVRVGEVSEISLSPDDIGRVHVRIAVDEETAITRDAVARVERKGLSDLRYVEIEQGSPEAGLLEPGSVIPWEPTLLERVSYEADDVAELTRVLLERAERILARAEEVSARVDPRVVDGIMGSAVTTTENLEASSAEIQALVSETRADTRRILADLRRATDELPGAVDEARQGFERAADTFDDIDALVADVRSVVRANEDQLRVTTYNLRQASESLKLLGRELRARPSRLLFGEAPAERELP